MQQRRLPLRRCECHTASSQSKVAAVSTHDGLARAVEPVALQVRCSHCHRRRCNCAGCRCAAVTAIRHPARARSQLDSTHDGLARAVEPVALQVRCIHCHRRRCNCADRRALATCGADCRCAAVTAIRHPARPRSQLIRLTMGYCHTASSQVALLWALRWLWFGCKPLEQCQGGLALR